MEQIPPSSSSKGSRNPRSSGPAWGTPGHYNTRGTTVTTIPILNFLSQMLAVCRRHSPGSMRHLMGVVVQSDDGLSLLNAGQYRHQRSVCHHQVQVVLGEVKVHRLKSNKKITCKMTFTSI